MGTDDRPSRPLRELQGSGLLWFINHQLLHPRGFALALDVDNSGEVTGWALLGDGSTPWRFEGIDEAGHATDVARLFQECAADPEAAMLDAYREAAGE